MRWKIRFIRVRSSRTTPSEPPPVAWRDLREWLSLVEANGLLKRIEAPVDPDEELAAITFMATRREDAPALLFNNLQATVPARAC